MTAPLPELYYRIRENGAFVFRIDTENRQRRIEMEQIAFANVKNGEIRPHGNRELSDTERKTIESWLTERRAVLDAREMERVRCTVEQMNLTTQWALSKATEEQLEEVTDALLLAMHDLRTILVRKKSDRLKNQTS